MDNVEIVREITDAFCRNRNDLDALDRYFGDNFLYTLNGERMDRDAFAGKLRHYMADYQGFHIPDWEECFAADGAVVTAYTLETDEKDGSHRRIPVMAVWHLENGKVVSLREIDACPR